MNDILILALALGGSILTVVFVLWIVSEVRKRVLTPSLTSFLSALEPYGQEAISGVEMLATEFYKKTGEFLAGDVKKALADDFYATLPDTIVIAGRPLPIGFIKVFVTKERWSAFIQDIFDKGDAKLSRNKDWLIKRLDALRITVDELDGEVDFTPNESVIIKSSTVNPVTLWDSDAMVSAVTVLYNGTRVTVDQVRNDCVRIMIEDGRYGWLHRDNLARNKKGVG